MSGAKMQEIKYEDKILPPRMFLHGISTIDGVEFNFMNFKCSEFCDHYANVDQDDLRYGAEYCRGCGLRNPVIVCDENIGHHIFCRHVAFKKKRIAPQNIIEGVALQPATAVA